MIPNYSVHINGITFRVITDKIKKRKSFKTTVTYSCLTILNHKPGQFKTVKEHTNACAYI